MKNILFAVLAMVFCSAAFAAPSSSWTPFGGEVTVESGELDSLPTGVMLALVVSLPCDDAHAAAIAAVTKTLPAASTGLFPYCPEPPAGYAACLQSAIATFNAKDSTLRWMYTQAVSTAQWDALMARQYAALDRDSCIVLANGDPAALVECDGIYCNTLDASIATMNAAVGAALTTYKAAASANETAFQVAVAACCF